MIQTADLIALLRLSILDPIEGGRRILALNPPIEDRWFLLAASVVVSVLLVYAPALLMTGGVEGLPAPFAFVALQGLMNLMVIGLITVVGRGFGGTGRFAGALWLVGWLQSLTALLLLPQLAAVLLVPSLHLPVAMASVALSIWVLVGFICALHGFASRVAVLIGAFMTFIVFSFVLSLVFLFLGLVPPDLSNV